MPGHLADYLLFTLTGVLSAPHCVGMCGGIMSAWTLNSPVPLMQTVLAYNLGRIATYTLVGAFMGFIGSFVEAAGKIVGIQGIANILGGLFIILWIFKQYALPIAKWTPLQIPAMQLLLNKSKNKKGLTAVFVSGLLLGFLPCGLTYAMHMKAAATGSVWNGALTLLFFGVGTLPALLFVGMFSQLLSRALRTRVLFAAKTLALFIGIVSILRGMAVNGWIPSVNPWLW
ncbi:sulfite exporter TauE/SafE family protein [Ferviditalea candida]|uniref:Sulfite exporter TauE/SafE family protein n=1 Tax=Ferviditalea candida TaxID=3108399 RepID=A0ABU5ZH93_9BACL|nr:sulfite exporter TauE/SafE family protein [Paenibacillaceae bacterium T2]